MVTFSPYVEAFRNDFKVEIYRLLEARETGLNQATIAGALVTSEATVSRWLKLHGEFNLPGFVLGILPAALSVPLLDLLARRHGYMVVRQNPVVGDLDGSVLDEAIQIVEHLGRVGAYIRGEQLQVDRCTKELDHIIDFAHRAKAKLIAIGKGIRCDGQSTHLNSPRSGCSRSGRRLHSVA